MGIIAGVALSTGRASATGRVQDAQDRAAMAIPRPLGSGVFSGADLPEPLAPSDAARIRSIFADQAHGRMARASSAMAGLQNRLLVPAILADRYLGRFHKSTVKELRSWLAEYGDQPEAPAIRALLNKRLPRGAPRPAERDMPHLEASGTPAVVPEFHDGDPDGIVRNPKLDHDVSTRLQNGEFASALELIARAKSITPEYAALTEAEVARALFTANWDAEAAIVAASAWRRSGPAYRIGNAAFVAGLAEWRMGRFGRAGDFFSDAADAQLATPATRAAAAYWAARAALQRHDADAADALLKQAVAQGTTFYGLIARRSLGWPVGLMPSQETLAQTDLKALSAFPGGLRVFALLQVGQVWRAEQELRFLWPKVKDNAALRRAMLLMAQRAGLIGLAAEITGRIQAAEQIPVQNFNFPVPRFRPDGGFRLNPALLYGIARTESNFDPKAVSAAGALGLMQLMPDTARSIANDPKLADARLQNSGVNLDLAQRWIESLADRLDGNLIALLASWNAGAAGFASWSGQIATDDPLLYIEAIPISETRHFVQRTLTYTWLYSARLGLPAPGLDALIAGAFPRFTSPENEGTLAASLQ